jgi:hypothetical protein
MSAPSLAGANHASPKDVLRQFLKLCSGTPKNVLSFTQIASGCFFPGSHGARPRPLAFRHSGFGTTQARTQNCMNLCEVGLVIVNGVFLGKTSRKGRLYHRSNAFMKGSGRRHELRLLISASPSLALFSERRLIFSNVCLSRINDLD